MPPTPSNTHTNSSPRLSSLLPSPTPPKRANKSSPFDPSKYATRHIALKFAYLGARYNGFEHHIGNTTPLPTIESELWKALVKTKLIFPESLIGNGEGIVGDWSGCQYSKCGRTDRGVSAFGQVIGVRVRSGRAVVTLKAEGEDGSMENGAELSKDVIATEEERPFDPIKDELPYIALLNRVLPPDIRMLAWCPNPPSNFDSRFSCKERKYRYFFTSPAFLPLPGVHGLSKSGSREAWLDIPAMQEAASYLVGTHDFRNFCKVDPSKQLTSFTRRITDAKIELATIVPSPDFVARSEVLGLGEKDELAAPEEMKLYSFTVQGSAFLWHQVRCMVAVMFLVGQGLEKASVVKDLLDVETNSRKPQYEMASDQPLVLWDTMFSISPEKGKFDVGEKPQGYVDRGGGEDELEWVYAADSGPGASNQAKWGPLGVMSDLWKSWRKVKMDEILASQLLDLVALQGSMDSSKLSLKPLKPGKENQRVFEGHDSAVPRGKYIPIMEKQKMDPVEVINARWAARKVVSTKAPEEVIGAD